MPLVPVLLAAFALTTAAPAGAPAGPTVLAAPPAPTAPAVTSLRFSPETLDLGEMISGKPKSGTLTVTNVTSAPLTIVTIKGACGCTTVSAPPAEPVPAGGSFTVQISVDPGAKTGIDLAKLVHFALEGDGGTKTQSMTVKGHVKTVVRVSPDVVDASLVPDGANGVVTLHHVDGKAFAVTSVEPAGLIQLPVNSGVEHTLTIDWQKWVAAGHPAKITVSTDALDAEKLVIPIRSAPAVALFRLPAASPEAPERAAIEGAQDDVIHAIDASFTASGRSKDLKIKLHRETGMLFVHGTDADVATVRGAVAQLGPSAGVRESSN